MIIVRSIIVVIAALLIAVQVVRNAAVEMLSAAKPAQASRVWSAHPAVELSMGMTDIAKAARSRQAVAPAALAMIADAAAKDPLAPEPFLVRGVQAEVAGDGAAAQRAFEAAQWRDPRSLPAAYFLADRYFRDGDVSRGLSEVAALARLSPHGDLAVAPYLAAYARNPSNWPALRTLFRGNPNLAQAALVALASNPATAAAAIALANPNQNAQDAHWLPTLLNTLTAAGKYQEARSVWARMSHARQMGLLFDASFRDTTSPPPFNWALTSSAVGLAERQAGRLHVIFYGQEDGVLARELLLLAPGQYRLSMQLLGDPARAHALTWSIWCDKSDAPIASASLDIAASKGLTFAVPDRCPAQWLRLSGMSGDMPQQVDLTIASLKLERTNGA